MKTRYIIPLIGLFPLTAFAGNSVIGTEDTTSGGVDNGVGQFEGNGYVFDVEGAKGGKLPSFQLYGTSSLDEAQWWVGKDSGAPWNYVAPDVGGTGDQPSLHATQQLCEGDQFFVGLSTSDTVLNYVSRFRMVEANTIFTNAFTQPVDIYFGLRDANAGGSLDLSSYVTENTGMTFQDGSAPTVDPSVANQSLVNEFSWIHYQTGADGGTGDIEFTIQGSKKDPLAITEWVAYFVLPDDGVGPVDCINNTPWTNNQDAQQANENGDLVFSWTVHAKDGNGDPNPEWEDDPGFEFRTVPEPSSALMLLGGGGLFFFRRNRKAA